MIITVSWGSIHHHTLFSHSVVSDSLQPHELQHNRLHCLSLSLKVGSDFCSFSQWCHPTKSFPAVPFSCLSLSQNQGLFQWVKLFSSGGQSTGASVSASVFPMNIQSRFSLGLTGLTFLLSKGLSRVFSSTTVRKHQFGAQPSVGSNSHMTPGKTIALTIWTFVGKVLSLLFNMLSRFIVAFLPRSKHLLISWLQSLSTVIFELKKIKFVTVSIFSPSICHEVMGPVGREQISQDGAVRLSYPTGCHSCPVFYKLWLCNSWDHL